MSKLIYPQVYTPKGEPLWKTKVNGKYTVTTTYAKGSRPYTVKDEERIEALKNKPKQPKKEKSPTRFITNKYLYQLECKRYKIVQSWKSIQPGKDESFLVSILEDAVHQRPLVANLRDNLKGLVAICLYTMPDGYIGLTLGPVGDRVAGQLYDFYPKAMTEFIAQNRWDLWFEAMRENYRQLGCDSYVLSKDILWGLIKCRLEPIGEFSDWLPKNPMDRNEIGSPGPSVPVTF
jgi:hypothetical protein